MKQLFTYNYGLNILKENDDFIDPTFIIECPPTPKLEYEIEDHFYYQKTFIFNDQNINNDKTILIVDNQQKQILEKSNEQEKKQERSIKDDEFDLFIRKSFDYLGGIEIINSAPSVSSDYLPIKKSQNTKKSSAITTIKKIQTLKPQKINLKRKNRLNTQK
ncbi:hypothetical protein ACTA71_007440 [Dictyostelium dimigraforme]